MSASETKEVRGILTPVGDCELMLPGAAVAEVIAFAAPVPMANSPSWMLGHVQWRMRRVPVVSVASAAATPAPLRPGFRARILICHSPNGSESVPYCGIYVEGAPRVTIFRESALQPVAEQPDNPFVLYEVAFETRRAWIPDFDAIENGLEPYVGR